MYKNWKEVAKIESSAVRISFVTASMESMFMQQVLTKEEGKKLFTEKLPHENPLPLSLGRELCEAEGQFIGEYNLLPICHIDDDMAYINTPEGVSVANDGETPYYDLFYCTDQDPVFVDVMGVKMLLIHFSQDVEGQLIDFVDPRCVDLDS